MRWMVAMLLVVIAVYWWELAHPPEARDYCPVQPFMRGTNDNCGRIPTIEKPPCPFPGGGQNIDGLVDSNINWLVDSNGRILK